LVSLIVPAEALLIVDRYNHTAVRQQWHHYKTTKTAACLRVWSVSGGV
jgi:hypothetical protein